MKNFFVSGLVFFAIGVFRLQQEVFDRHPTLQLALLVSGLALMLVAANYAPVKAALSQFQKNPPAVVQFMPPNVAEVLGGNTQCEP
jgi:hypothetical protein